LPLKKRSLCTHFWNSISLGDYSFMSIRLYVGNLPKEEIERDTLAAMFADEGDQVSTKVIKDRKTGKCRGFAFVTVPTDELADQFIEKYNGQSFMDNPIKIEKALPRSKGEDAEVAAEGNNTTTNNTDAPKRKAASKRSSGKKPSTAQKQQGSIQPDPRWADELAKLKEMLAAANN
jgi:RNA recognition motif-containing protein